MQSATRMSSGNPKLTVRERQVCEALLLGLANKQVAGNLGISASAVKKHLTSCFRKFGEVSRVGLALAFACSYPGHMDTLRERRRAARLRSR